VLFHWACEKIRAARGSAQTDEQLCQTILEKFQRCPGIGSWDFRNAEQLWVHHGHGQGFFIMMVSNYSNDSNDKYRSMMVHSG